MSIWTFRHRVLSACFGVALVLTLSGCLAADTGSERGLAKPKVALASATIVPDKLVVKGPKGFCIDRRSLKSGRSGGFALLVSCAALDEEARGIGLETAILTLQAQPQSKEAARAEAGSLARAFAGIQPIYQENGDGMSLVHLAQGGDVIIPNGEPKHWRAALNFNGYLVGLALYSEKGGVASGGTGKALLIEFAEAVLAANLRADIE